MSTADMDETFYTALGVAADADADAIREAYRDRVKESHPDVSDDPGAPREFRRLTTARDVLVDDEERARYDRLGHATYVSRHVETSVWSASESGQSARSTGGTTQSAGGATLSTGGATQANGGTTTRGDRTRRSSSGSTGYDRSAWLGEDWEGPRDRSSTTTGASRSADGGSGTDGATWQQASAAYRYSPSSVPTETRTVGRSIGRALRKIGPWLVVHLILLACAVATAWYTYAGAAAVAPITFPALAFGLILVGLVLFLSTLHIVSLLFT